MPFLLIRWGFRFSLLARWPGLGRFWLLARSNPQPNMPHNTQPHTHSITSSVPSASSDLPYIETPSILRNSEPTFAPSDYPDDQTVRRADDQTMPHGNIGHRIKHLIDTSSCLHHRLVRSPTDKETRCATHTEQCRAVANGRTNILTRACHVIPANQNSEVATRYIVYCCASCNGNRTGEISTIRKNAIKHNLDGKPCRTRSCSGTVHPLCMCGRLP